MLINRPQIIGLILLSVLITPLTAQTLIYDSWLAFFEGYNMLGWKLVGVYARLRLAYDPSAHVFVMRGTYHDQWTWKASWCILCYARILDVEYYPMEKYIIFEIDWEAGSWNKRFLGEHRIRVWLLETPGYVDGQIRVRWTEEDRLLELLRSIIGLLPLFLELGVRRS